MGIFKAKDPHKNIYSTSGGRILSRDIDGTNMKYLIFVGISAKPDNKDAKVASLEVANMSSAFKEFAEAFLNQFNKQFPNAATTPVGLDYVSLPEWPNYNIAKADRPSQIGQSQYIEHDFTGDPVSQKKTSIIIFIDESKVGKLFALRKKNGNTSMEEIVDLKVSKDDEVGMALWTISASSPNVYSSLFLDMYFTAGSNKPDKLLLGLPTRQSALPIGMALASSGLK
jgi:hypothetical protein